MTMEVGKRYRGSAIINEFGEISFRPYMTGEKPRDPFRMLTGKGSGDCSYAIDYNQQTLRIHVSVPRNAVTPIRRSELLQNLFINALVALGEYEL